MKRSEKEIQNDIRLAVGKSKATLFRNNTGMIKDADGRAHRFGLCKGSSDLIGFVPVTITADMVGQEIAVFAAVEVKTPTGRVSDHQKDFISFVSGKGGVAGIARSADEALSLLGVDEV